jgi:HD-GYP domain-containing protein (c-di-GMP phosphodiesterase class II)
VYDIIDAGGLRSDMGAVAFPVYIAICGLLFGKRGIFFFSLISILAISTIGILELNGSIIGVGNTDIFDIVTVVVLVVGMSIILWVIIDNNRQNLLQIQNKEEILQISNELTLESLAKVLEYRDLETKNHSSRVVEMSVKLAREVGLRDEELNTIKRGALIHDIGKLAIPDSILQKPGKLSEEEWAIMKTHPAKAVEILETIPILKFALEIPYCHHENWDGTGYPRGLAGEQIPLYARIFTIIDQWEALTDDRVYRKAWPYEKVISYIKDNTGRIYDPQIANTFLQLLKTNPEYFLSSHLVGTIPVPLI